MHEKFLNIHEVKDIKKLTKVTEVIKQANESLTKSNNKITP